jgi:N-carbamoyl-L-amino-acid hydrolase
MQMRDDALVKAGHIITAVNRVVTSAGPAIVGTIGELKVHPGAFNVIPERVEMYLDLRSSEKDTIQSVRENIQKIVHSVDNAHMEHVVSKGGVIMDSKIVEAIEMSCRERGIRSKRMWSGAGHDAMTFPTQRIPTGMIFIPCVEGKSHCPDEAIRWEDAASGAQILADTIWRISSAAL